jgi:hypothetical protein
LLALRLAGISTIPAGTHQMGLMSPTGVANFLKNTFSK